MKMSIKSILFGVIFDIDICHSDNCSKKIDIILIFMENWLSFLIFQVKRMFKVSLKRFLIILRFLTVFFHHQIQLGRQMLRASAHQAPDGHHRRLHHTQLAVAGQTRAVAQQEGHGAGHLNVTERTKKLSTNPRSIFALTLIIIIIFFLFNPIVF